MQIRFDGLPGHEAGRFVEVENDQGESICAGEWKQDGEYWLLVIPENTTQVPSELKCEGCGEVYTCAGALTCGQCGADIGLQLRHSELLGDHPSFLRAQLSARNEDVNLLIKELVGRIKERDEARVEAAKWRERAFKERGLDKDTSWT